MLFNANRIPLVLYIKMKKPALINKNARITNTARILKMGNIIIEENKINGDINIDVIKRG